MIRQTCRSREASSESGAEAVLEGLVARLVRSQSRTGPLGIAAASVPGGLGKTTLVTHTAWLGAELGLRVLCVDRDSQLRAWERLVGSEIHPADRVRKEFAPGCSVIAGRMTPATMRGVRLSEFDLLIVDTRCDEHEALPDGVDELDLVVMPVRDEESSRDLLLLRDQIRARPWKGRAPRQVVSFMGVNLENPKVLPELQARGTELEARGVRTIPGGVPRAISIENAKDGCAAWRIHPRTPADRRAAMCLRAVSLAMMTLAASARGGWGAASWE